MLRKWDDLPEYMKNEMVRKYYDALSDKMVSLFFKRICDFMLGVFTFLVLSPFFVIISILIKLDSKGPVMFRQVRVTQYGRKFEIFKFRTMVENAEKIGTQVTTKNDIRVTDVGCFLRKYRLDEIPQLFNIILGEMSFVGTRPEVPKYVYHYSDEMFATLLLPAGVTSEASIQYKDEEKLFTNTVDTEFMYIKKVLPSKMRYNLRSIEEYSLINDIKIMVKTIFAVIKRDKDNDNGVKM